METIGLDEISQSKHIKKFLILIKGLVFFIHIYQNVSRLLCAIYCYHLNWSTSP